MLTLSSKPLTVGAITDEKALALTFDLQSADLFELRLDALGSGSQVIDFAERHHVTTPLLMTARDPAEGGLNSLSHEERASHLHSLLPYASAIDVELANVGAFADLLTEAKSRNIKIVLSNHDFLSFDHLGTIEKIAQAQASGADIAKAAVTLADPVDLTLFESLLADMSGAPFSLMGMGPYGPVSRILAAQHGSLLNYGFLGNEPTAPGQWPARLLKEVLAATPPITVAP